MQDSEENTVNRLSSSVMGPILDSSNSSNGNEDTVSEYKQRETKITIISQDSPSTSQMRTKRQKIEFYDLCFNKIPIGELESFNRVCY